MTPLVSVCIPVFNGERHLGDTLASVLSQSMGDFEVVISDNCSTDGTVDVVRRFGDPRVRLVSNDRNIGAIGNWNRVRAEARGRYVKFLPADDLLYAECLALQVAALDAEPSVALAAGRRDIVAEDGTVFVKGRGLPGLRGRVDGRRVVRRTVRGGTNIIGEPAFALLRADVLSRCPPFDEAFPYAVDLRLWCDVLLQGDLFAHAETVGAFRVQLASESVNMGRTQARQVRGFYRELRTRHPDVVSALDVAVGGVRAAALARLRALLYRRVRRRVGGRLGAGSSA